MPLRRALVICLFALTSLGACAEDGGAQPSGEPQRQGSLIPLDVAPDAEAATARRWRELGPLGYALAVAVMIAAAFLPVPMEVPAVINGIAFGAVGGSIVTWIGGFLGATLSYEVALKLGRALAGARVAAKAQAAAQRVLSSGGGVSMLLLRLMPLVAFHALNWGSGLAHVRRSRFYWTTAVGIAPACIVLSASGTMMAAAMRRYMWPSVLVLCVLALVVVAAAFLRARRSEPNPTVGA